MGVRCGVFCILPGIVCSRLYPGMVCSVYILVWYVLYIYPGMAVP